MMFELNDLKEYIKKDIAYAERILDKKEEGVIECGERENIEIQDRYNSLQQALKIVDEFRRFIQLKEEKCIEEAREAEEEYMNEDGTYVWEMVSDDEYNYL